MHVVMSASGSWRLGPPPAEAEPLRWWRRRPVSRRARHRALVARRALAGGLAGLAVLVGLRVAYPAPVDTGVPVVVLASDLPAGARPSEADLHLVLRPADTVPPAAVRDLADAAGQVLAGPVTAGEILTTARLRGARLLTGQPAGRVAVSVGLADPGMVTFLRPGDEVSVLTRGAGAVVARATVLSVQEPERVGGVGLGGAGHVVVALTATEAQAVAAATGGADGGFVLAVHAG